MVRLMELSTSLETPDVVKLRNLEKWNKEILASLRKRHSAPGQLFRRYTFSTDFTVKVVDSSGRIPLPFPKIFLSQAAGSPGHKVVHERLGAMQGIVAVERRVGLFDRPPFHVCIADRYKQV